MHKAITSCRLASTTTYSGRLCPLNTSCALQQDTHTYLHGSGGVDCVTGCATESQAVEGVVLAECGEIELFSVTDTHTSYTYHTHTSE